MGLIGFIGFRVLGRFGVQGSEGFSFRGLGSLGFRGGSLSVGVGGGGLLGVP